MVWLKLLHKSLEIFFAAHIPVNGTKSPLYFHDFVKMEFRTVKSGLDGTF
jgi:hypothetical protein